MTTDDLASYRAVERKPVSGTYRGYSIASMPPPSSGGVHVIEILNILEGYPLGEQGLNSAASLHEMAEAESSPMRIEPPTWETRISSTARRTGLEDLCREIAWAHFADPCPPRARDPPRPA